MPVPVVLPPISEFEQVNLTAGLTEEHEKGSVFETAGIPSLPKVYPEDRKVADPQRFFRFAAGSRYSYIRLLGHGAYGYVCAAMDLEAGIPVAIKRINQINNDLVARRTLRELRLLRHFQGHPNIINIRDILKPAVGNFEELFISQELMDADLCHVIQPRFPIREEHVRLFVFQMLCGLKALHSANVIHRDLKPGNILWRHTGDLKICDFGLARGLNETMDGMDSTMTAYVATRWYRPPEILLSRSRYGKPCTATILDRTLISFYQIVDMWSVGCIFAELLGRKIFLPGQTGFDQLNLIIQKLGTPTPDEIAMVPSTKARQYLQRLPHYPRHPLSARFSNASPEAVDLLEQLLQFEPTKRITVDDALRHSFLAPLIVKALPEQLSNYPSFDFAFDYRLKTLAELKTAILEEVQIYHSLATLGLPAKLSAMHLTDHSTAALLASNSEEDERVMDGLLQRHIQTHYKRTPFGFL